MRCAQAALGAPGPGAPSEQQPHPLAPATENTDGSLPANQKKQGRHTVYYHLSQLHLIRSTVAERYYQQIEFVNQALTGASRKRSGNIFSVKKSLQCRPLLFFRLNNSPVRLRQIVASVASHHT